MLIKKNNLLLNISLYDEKYNNKKNIQNKNKEFYF